ncbi:hypothetical protein ACUTAF_04195 [Pseudomonas sp. SP16.1]|uniref:hypothetical protein n=1 Tax=Pseudomonas sp. SP16.1 TaxID=3458854 RepID=UPI004045E72B
MNSIPRLLAVLLCASAGSALADDPGKDYREAHKRYWEHVQEMDKDGLEAEREHRKLHEEMDREERKHFEEMQREDVKHRPQYRREWERAYHE